MNLLTCTRTGYATSLSFSKLARWPLWLLLVSMLACAGVGTASVPQFSATLVDSGRADPLRVDTWQQQSWLLTSGDSVRHGKPSGAQPDDEHPQLHTAWLVAATGLAGLVRVASAAAFSFTPISALPVSTLPGAPRGPPVFSA